MIKCYSVKYIRDVDWVSLCDPASNKGKQTVELSDFSYPWENEKAPLTIFKACHNDHWLYCQFKVVDKDIQVFVDKNTKDEVTLGDRVEIFFRKDEKLDPYYCFEIDLHGRIYDYHSCYYRKFDIRQVLSQDRLKVEAGKTDNGYKVTIAFNLESLKELGLLNGNELQAGLFRGKCVSLNKQDGNMRWISWVKPASETPDFHIPSSFGILRLEKWKEV